MIVDPIIRPFTYTVGFMFVDDMILYCWAESLKTGGEPF